MKNNQESKSFWKGKGFYLALTLVIAGAATASFLAINSMMDKLGADPAPQIQGEEDIPWQEEQHTPVEEKQEDVPVAPTSPSSSSKPQSTVSSAPSSSPASSAPAAPASSQPVQTPSFASPRAGAALQAFSGDELVFNDTMKDWRTHNGMDLAGAAGDAVTAPTGAVVARAYEDPQWPWATHWARWASCPPRAPWKRMCIWSSWRTALMWTRRNISPRWNKAAHERRRADGKTRCPRAAFCCARPLEARMRGIP